MNSLIATLSTYVEPEIALLIQEYLAPSLRIRNKTLSLYCVKDDGDNFHSTAENELSNVTSGLWITTWGPYTGHDLGFLYRCLILHHINFNLTTLPSMFPVKADHAVTRMRCNTVLIIKSGSNTHVLDLKLPSNDQTRLQVGEALMRNIYGSMNEKGTIEAVVIPISYQYEAGRRISDGLYTLHQDEKYVKGEIGKLVKGASVKIGEYVSFPVSDKELYLTIPLQMEFNRIFICIDGIIFLKKGSKKIATIEIDLAICTPLLMRIFKIIMMTSQRVFNSRFLSDHMQRVIDNIVKDENFSGDKAVRFRSDLTYTLHDNAPSHVVQRARRLQTSEELILSIYNALLTGAQFT